jgi:hypothetical protein
MSILSDELTNDPLGLDYAAHLPDCPGVVCDMLNLPVRAMPQERFVTVRTVLAECAGGAQILDKLEGLASMVPEVKWAMRLLDSGTGIDVGFAGTRTLLDALAAQGALTQGEADALKNLAIQPCSRAHELGLPHVTEDMLRTALET